MRREIMTTNLRMEASFDPKTADPAARTIELRFYSGARVDRYDIFEGPYKLQFSLEPGAVRLERLNAGAPLKGGHRANDDLSGIFGVIERAWVEADGGHALARFSERPEVEPFFQDVLKGVIRNVSMEAKPHVLKDVTPKGGKVREYLATDWEPLAVALVGVNADPGAHALAQAEKFPCELLSGASVAPNREKAMKVRLLADIEDVGKAGEIVEIEEMEFDDELHSKELRSKEIPPQPDDRSEDLAMQDALESDTKRVARLREIATHFELDDLWIRRHSKRGSTVKEALSDARKQAAKTEPDVDGRLTYGEDYNSIGWTVARMSEALSARASAKACPEPARPFAQASIAECAFGVLEKLGQTRGRALDPLRRPEDVIKLALSTSDFTGLLANSLNKNLLEKYMLAMPSFRAIALRRNFKDYRPHTFHRSGDFPLPLQVGENGEITQGSMGESKETVTALRYGRILPLSLEILVNDDLSAFTDFGDLVARRIMDFENATFYARVITTGSGLGGAMADGVAVYNSAHANVNSAGALDNTRLNEAFGLMAAQTSIDGLKLNVPPRFVLTSPTSHILARTLLTAIQASQASNVNPFAGLMEPIFDANLSGTRYYVMADPSLGANYVYGTINGQGPRFAVREGWENEGVQVRVSHDFGCGAIDYRYGVTGAGS